MTYAESRLKLNKIRARANLARPINKEMALREVESFKDEILSIGLDEIEEQKECNLVKDVLFRRGRT